MPNWAISLPYISIVAHVIDFVKHKLLPVRFLAQFLGILPLDELWKM